jgi:hypothetical protein
MARNIRLVRPLSCRETRHVVVILACHVAHLELVAYYRICRAKLHPKHAAWD